MFQRISETCESDNGWAPALGIARDRSFGLGGQGERRRFRERMSCFGGKLDSGSFLPPPPPPRTHHTHPSASSVGRGGGLDCWLEIMSSLPLKKLMNIRLRNSTVERGFVAPIWLSTGPTPTARERRKIGTTFSRGANRTSIRARKNLQPQGVQPFPA